METKERIEKKCDLIIDYVDELSSFLPDDIKTYIKDIKTKNAAERLAQKIIESSMDVVAMLCSLRGCPSSTSNDYYSMIEDLSKKGILKDRTKSKLIELRGFRNIVVHEYEGIEDERALEVIRELLGFYRNFVEEVLEKL